MKRRHAVFFLAALLVACGRDDASLGISDEPAVAISQIDGPLVGSRAGALVDAVDARTPRSGALLVAAAQQYDPVTGQTSDNPISVYVTASDELGLDAVELLLNGTTMGTYLESSDVQVFGNPFIFPAPRGDYLSVPIPGSLSGLVASQLRARATDTTGQLGEEAVLVVQADGSRPDLSLSALGDGPPFVGPVTLNAQAADPETGIRSFAAFLNGEVIEINPATPNSFSITQDLEPGTQTVRLVATNGVFVPNEALFSFVVAEAPEDSEDGEGEAGNQQPTVSLLAAPTEGEPPLAVSFTASASDPDGDKVTYLYDFGDGVTTAGAPAASHTYTEAGTYTATVTVDDSKGGTGSSSATITVGDGGDDGADGGDDGGDDGGGNDGGDGDDGGGDGGTAAPTVTSFTANGQSEATKVAPNAEVTLAWSISGTVTEVTISPEVGDVTTNDNQVTVTPTETTTYTITAINEEGSDAETVRVVVADDNGGVNAVDDAAETVAGEPVVIEVLENDEPNAGALTIIRATAPVRGGEVRISRDSRTITYTPPADFSGTDTFRYTVRDGEGNTSTATVTIQVGTPD